MLFRSLESGSVLVAIDRHIAGIDVIPVETGADQGEIDANPAGIFGNPVRIDINLSGIGEPVGSLHGAEPAIHEIQYCFDRDLNFSGEARYRSDSKTFPSHSRYHYEVPNNTNPTLSESVEVWAMENLSTVR